MWFLEEKRDVPAKSHFQGLPTELQQSRENVHQAGIPTWCCRESMHQHRQALLTELGTRSIRCMMNPVWAWCNGWSGWTSEEVMWSISTEIYQPSSSVLLTVVAKERSLETSQGGFCIGPLTWVGGRNLYGFFFWLLCLTALTSVLLQWHWYPLSKQFFVCSSVITNLVQLNVAVVSIKCRRKIPLDQAEANRQQTKHWNF